MAEIRALARHDLPMVLAWRNHPGVRDFMFTRHEISLDEHCKWFERARHDPARRLLIIEEKGKPLGYVQFSRVDEGGVANWGFYTGPEAPKGTGRKLGMTALDYAFKSLCLHKVCGRAVASNQASIALHKKLGFVEEGVLRDQQRIDGAYHSLVCFGLLKHEWQPH